MKRDFNGFDDSSSGDGPSDEDIEKWLQAVMPEGLHYLMRCRGIPYSDANDIIGNYFAGNSSRDKEGRIEILDTPLFFHRLKQAAASFYAYERAERRWGKATRVNADDLEGQKLASTADTRRIPTMLDEFRLRELQLRSIESKCSPQENLVREKMLEMLSECTCDKKELKFRFSKKEIRFLMMDRGKTKPYTFKSFRGKVQRLRRKIEAKINTLGRSPDGHWFN